MNYELFNHRLRGFHRFMNSLRSIFHRFSCIALLVCNLREVGISETICSNSRNSCNLWLIKIQAINVSALPISSSAWRMGTPPVLPSMGGGSGIAERETPPVPPCEGRGTVIAGNGYVLMPIHSFVHYAAVQEAMPTALASAVSTAMRILSNLPQLICFDILN